MNSPAYSAALEADGTVKRFVGVDRSQTHRVSAGICEVTFERSVVNCVAPDKSAAASPQSLPS